MDPTTFGPFKILRKLSGGGMGRVYLAEDTTHNARMTALKLIDIVEDQEGREVLEAERRGAILQKHFARQEPRVTIIYDYAEREGYFYIAMEYVAGRDLSELLEHGPLAPEEAVRIARELCEVLEKSHRFRACVEGQEVLGIVHGDIKPRNVRITPDRQIKLLDFGIAKAISVTRKYTRNPFGSTAYSSPERLVTGDVDVASDVWAVGVMLFEMLTGKRYFQADQESRLEALIRRYNEVAPLPGKIPHGLQVLLRKALAPDPVMRFGTASELGAALRAVSLAEVADDATTRPAYADVEATRRTARSPLPPPLPPNVDATRRTTWTRPPEVPPAYAKTTTGKTTTLPPPIRPVGAVPPLPQAKKSTWHVFKRGMQVGLLGAIALTGCSQVSVWKEAGVLERDIQSEHMRDMDAAWRQYQSLETRNHVPFALHGVRKAIEERMLRSADQVLADYRENDQVVVTVARWQRAAEQLRHALEMSPSDKKIKSKLRVCEGHIARINLNRANQAQMLQDAKQDFEEAQELASKTPDPLLGLARLYLANFHDVERGEEYLRKADRNGHPLGRREKALLGDAYAYRGDELAREAARVKGLSQERDDLDRADQAYRRAEELYGEVSPYGETSTLLRRVHASRERISTTRDQALRSGL